MHRRFLSRRNVLDGPPIDFPEARRDRTHLDVGPGRKGCFDFGQPLGDLLASEIDVGPVAKHGRDLGKAIAREGPGIFKPWRAGERGLNRKRNLLFYFERRERGRKGVDLDLNVGDIGNGVDRQPGQGPRA